LAKGVIQLPQSVEVNRKAMKRLHLSPLAQCRWKTIGEHADELISNANKLPIGEHADELITIGNKLPNSWFTVAQIAALPAETRLG
jgi:hypothetical protein